MIPVPVLNSDLDRIVSSQLPWNDLHARHILVTGAAGFIGGHIVETLAWLNRKIPSAKIQIYALSRDLQKLKNRLPWINIPEELIPVIRDINSTWDSPPPFDLIIHAASPAIPDDYLKKPVDTILANSLGTHLLLEIARQTNARFLFLSSGVVYGQNVQGIEEIRETDYGAEDPLAPRACYSEGKRLAETLCAAYHTQYKLHTLIARISHSYGPGMQLNDGRAITSILADILAWRDVRLDSDGSASRPFCYVSDTVLGLFHILFKGKPGQAYNLGGILETTIADLALQMIAVSGRKKLSLHINTRQDMPPAPRSSGHFNIDKIKALGWEPRIPLRDGLQSLFKFYGQ